MIVIDCIYINNGGGKVLLDYLVDTIENTNLRVIYLFDNRIKKHYSIKSSNDALYMKSSLRSRFLFYLKYQQKISKVFVLGNIPPLLRIKNATVYTYFHNTIYLDVPNDFSLVEHIKYYLKVLIIKMVSRNTDFWIVQTNEVYCQFIQKFKQKNKIKIIPFFSDFKEKEEVSCSRIQNTFLYVSNGQANKNHIRLIKAFCKAYDISGKGKLILTIGENFSEIILLIEEMQNKGYPIHNLGLVEREDLRKIYLSSEYIIYPSLSESFGLGLLEGGNQGCKIIGADLPYTYSICEPSLVFNPLSENSIRDVIISALNSCQVGSKIKVRDQINEIVFLLRKK
ncbi:glycosyltransferase [Myroides marinus]|uniref:glycosyltransferase n=1 Tax=Myroides marinus TaxID=703342 RepID=UPI0025767FBD|nr:glycosyltransferase [Myroides marinus]MDM1370040.1 glycosyltransferase [Myroides marinus]MDM1534079.1 glycosyltransferase [Myroides marinus]MDM1541043.1 glycosyltransferase [Myroides marinus]